MGSLDQLNQWNYSSDMSDFSDYLRSSGNGTVEDLDNILGVLQDNTSWDDDDEMMMNAVNFSDSNDLPEFLPSDLPILPEQQQLSSPVLKPLETSLATQVTHSTPTAPTPVLSAADKMRVFKQLQLQQQKELQQQQQQTQQQTQQQQPSQQQQQPSQQQPSQQPIVLSPQSQQQQSQQQPQQQSNTNPLQQIIKLDTSTPQKQLLVVVPPSTWFTNADTAVVTQPQVVIQQADGTNNVTTTTQGNTVSSITTLPVSSVTTLTTSVDKLPISPSPSSKGTQPQLPKGEKRVAHNAIEKRYRRSINDRIETLRQMVVGSDAKIQKSGILQRAIDQINYLRKLSEKLKNENTDLRAQINRMKGAASMIIKAEPPTPPASETQSPRPSPGQMEIIEPPSPKSESGETGIIGMTDRSRFTLCIFMFAVLLFNPFGFLLGKAAQNFAAPEATFEHVMDGGRTLKGVTAEEEMSPLWSLAMSSSVWVVNAILILAVIIQILIKGEPVTKPNSEASAEYWRHRQAAETEIRRNEHVYALSQTQLALKALGRNIPVSRFDMWACTVWNFLRFFLNKVFIGRWLAKRAGGYEKDDSEDGKYTTAETSARDAAVMYLQYLQIALVSSKPLSALSVTSIGLVTLNLAHCAGNALSSESIAEVYATVALAIKHTFPRKMRFVSRYFFSKGRTYAKEYNTPAYLSWMHNAMAYQLVKQEDIPFVPRKSLFSQIAEPSNPLSCLTQGLHEEMLETALYQLVVPMEKNGKKDLLNGEPQDALHILAYLEDPDSCGRPPQDTLSFVDCRDVCRWWSEIIIVAAHWMLGDEEAAERRYYSLEKLPAVLEFSDDSLPKAALLAFKARKLLMSAGGNQDTEDISEECKILCDKASTYLQRSISYTGPLRHEKLHAGIHLLVADWLLATRTTLWQQRQPKESSRTHLATSSELDMFQQDLSALRRVASSIKSVMPKVYLYQAVSRFMAGANPAQTQQLLDRSLRQKIPSNSSSMFAARKDNPDVVVSKRDRGQALIVACRYLPESILSYPNQRERMLNEAARCFEQAGDRWGLKECQQLLANVKKECGEAGEGISRRSAILTS